MPDCGQGKVILDLGRTLAEAEDVDITISHHQQSVARSIKASERHVGDLGLHLWAIEERPAVEEPEALTAPDQGARRLVIGGFRTKLVVVRGRQMTGEVVRPQLEDPT